ncbi:amino acid ABC transporter permease [Phreatobacter sp. AB_2022a]|uniref:amino acid ABC transporter permease n=1 Tax=Phreatobacter sp. AB_2022a TaxID=3003134 RepID=UPI0022870B42|nr:amino acid ABC transporter permease [Phreatobacter sp. AB_2022a]MCZ0737364.1 amino acid ABC transporter permease [Phreatobacter sp. AB_2022a]
MTQGIARATAADPLRRAAPSLFRRLREGYFSSPLDAAISLACIVLLVAVLVPVVRWAVLDANFAGTTRADCTAGGACWVFIKARLGQFMYGLYPAEERWRVDLLALLLLAVTALSFWRGMPQRVRVVPLLWLVTLVVGLWLLAGGLGLARVETRQWGGLMLTIFLSVYAGVLAVPLGIVMALGRRSELPVIRLLSTIFIEFWRGVPIVMVIFLATLLLPLIMPAGWDIDRLARAVIGLAFVISAYMAEAVRGGLQAVPRGQTEAAAAAGLGYWTTTRLIVLPQALRVALPAMTNEFIALVKNTSLVSIVSIFDLLGIAQASLADPAWVGMNKEAYVFSGAVYWLICFGLSRWARRLEGQKTTY